LKSFSNLVEAQPIMPHVSELSAWFGSPGYHDDGAVRSQSALELSANFQHVQTGSVVAAVAKSPVQHQPVEKGSLLPGHSDEATSNSAWDWNTARVAPAAPYVAQPDASQALRLRAALLMNL
jgi:hypothetical protein